MLWKLFYYKNALKMILLRESIIKDFIIKMHYKKFIIKKRTAYNFIIRMLCKGFYYTNTL